MGGRSAIAGILACAALAAAAPAGAATIKEYSIGAYPGQQPRYIKAGPEGNLWFTDGGTQGGIGRISPQGEVFTEFGGLGPVELAFGPGGVVYWAGDKSVGERTATGFINEATDAHLNYAGAMSPNGEFWFSSFEASWCHPPQFGKPQTCATFFSPSGRITGIAFDRTGRAWAAFNESNFVREISGPEFLKIELPPKSRPVRIAIGRENDLWVTMFDASAVDRITTTGERTRFPLSPGAGPNDIALGPDGAFWITEYEAGKIARMTTSGEVTGEYPLPTPGAHPTGIAAGPDGAMWFTEINTAKIGRISIDASTTTPAPGGGAGPSATHDTTAPAFTHAPALHPSRFRDGGRSGGRIPKGSSLSFTLSEAAGVKALVAVARPGRKVHGSCVGVSRSNRGKPHCRRYTEVGSLSYKALQGANRFAFSGRVAGHSLRPGEYRLSVVATDAAGNGSAPAKVTFTIAP